MWGLMIVWIGVMLIAFGSLIIAKALAGGRARPDRTITIRIPNDRP